MKIAVAVALGFLSGLLIYLETFMLVFDPEIASAAPMAAVLISLGIGLAAWGISAYLMTRGAGTVSIVFSRGFLIGAAEWLAMIPVGMIYSARVAGVATAPGTATDAAKAGAALGAGFITIVTGGLSIFMAVVCLICFAVAFGLSKTMKTAPARKCPMCAELIQLEARKCRYCGAELAGA